jgi:hypothetical protein
MKLIEGSHKAPLALWTLEKQKRPFARLETAVYLCLKQTAKTVNLH